jgi:hypothetical protein
MKEEKRKREETEDALKVSLCRVYNGLVGYRSNNAQPTID